MAEKVVIGNAELWHGDCREVLPLLPKHDLLLTDPPYGTRGKDAESRHDAANGWRQYGVLEWDRERPAGWLFGLMREKGAECVVWGGNYFADVLPPSMRWLVWDKMQGEFSLADCEFAWTSQNAAARIFRYSRGAALQDGKKHPTQKPVALMKWCLGFLPDAKTILDPFMGSGTTLVACQRMGRHGTGIELDPDYFEIACKRVDEAARQPDLFIAPPDKPVQEVLL